MQISVVVPVYQRPEELQSFLGSLCQQTDLDFEVVIVENGSKNISKEVVHLFSDRLNTKYVTYLKGKQGGAKNYGMSVAKGEFFVLFDSDTLIPSDYISKLKQKLAQGTTQVYGGADALYPKSTPFQKAADYVMTGWMTTAGTRGAKKKIGKFYARGFNMGLSKQVFERTKGFKYPNFGEDMELSRRAIDKGFVIELFSDLVVYHQRKKTLKGLYRQLYSFGRTRIALYKQFRDMLKPMHLLPVFFCLAVVGLIGLAFIRCELFQIASIPFILYIVAVWFEATVRYKNIVIGFLAVITTFTLMFAYGLGFMTEFVKRVMLKKGIPEYRTEVFLD